MIVLTQNLQKDILHLWSEVRLADAAEFNGIRFTNILSPASHTCSQGLGGVFLQAERTRAERKALRISDLRIQPPAHLK